MTVLLLYTDWRRSVHDLPQLYTRPSAQDLSSALETLALTPTTFSGMQHTKPLNVSSGGVAAYLTQVIASRLLWLPESVREEVWEVASTRLAERSGRSAAPSMTRDFVIDESLTISLHEPSLTGDMLGLKTWSSSLMLASRLKDLERLLPSGSGTLRVLELGAGTGLVGIAAACKWSSKARPVHVSLTDLPYIVPNLTENVERNASLVAASFGVVTVYALDWADEANARVGESASFPIIVAADPLYSADHPKLFVQTVGRWLERSQYARFVVAVPLRDGYGRERTDMRQRLHDIGLQVDEEGEDKGFDDWEGRDGQRQEVRYSWSIWKGSARWCPPDAAASINATETYI